MAIPRVINNLVPEAIKHRLRFAANQRSLAAQEQLSFNASCLRPVSAVDLPAIMADKIIAESYLADAERIAASYPVGEIYGGINPGDRRALYHLIAHFKPRRVLEIGTHVGASTVFIAAALQRYASETARLTTVDIVDVNSASSAWSIYGLPKSPARFIAELGAAHITTFVNCPALDVLANGERYDFIFLDGDHSGWAVYREIAAALKALQPSGVILLHDFYPERKPLMPDGNIIVGPAMAAERISRESGNLRFLPLGNLPWETKSGGNATSLALVAKHG